MLKRENNIPNNLLDQLKKENLNPTDLVFYINSNCNLRCKHCYIGNELLDSNYYYNLADSINFIESFSNLDRITVLGGEPLLYPNLDIFINSIDLTKIGEFRLTTNLYDLTFFQKFSTQAKKKIRICVSIDGHNSKTHDFIRGKGNFARTISNIKKLINQNIDVEITYTLMTINIHFFMEFVELCKSIKIKRINLHRMSLQGNALNNKNLQVTPTDYMNFCNELRNNSLKSTNSLSIRYPILFANDKTFGDITKQYKYQPHSKKSYYGSGQRIVIYPNCKIYISSELFGTNSFIGHFTKDRFFFNQTNKNELIHFQNNKTSIPDLNPLQKGDINFPHVLSVSFKETISL